MIKVTTLELETPEERKAVANFRQSKSCYSCKARRCGKCALLKIKVSMHSTCDFWEGT
jgi:hypothetical protein